MTHREIRSSSFRPSTSDALSQTESDLPALQALVEHEAMKRANYEAWVALGIAFGDVLPAVAPVQR
jgi:hypothetical protein